jgi:hypothetical protein
MESSQREASSPDWRLIPSYSTMNIPAYGASRNEDARNPRKSSEGPRRAMDRKAPGRLVYAYRLLCKESDHSRRSSTTRWADLISRF